MGLSSSPMLYEASLLWGQLESDEAVWKEVR